MANSRVIYSDKEGSIQEKAECNGTDGEVYHCSTGHCCTEQGCCSSYYELWWFWLVWAIVIILTCCCAYHQHQKRVQRPSNRGRRRRRREAYAGVCNYPGPPLDNKVIGYCKLPVYDDIIRIPPTTSPPPPYRARRSIHTIACLQPNDTGEATMRLIPCNITSSMLSVNSLSHYVSELLEQTSIRPMQPTSPGFDNINHTIETSNDPVCDWPQEAPGSENETQTNPVDSIEQESSMDLLSRDSKTDMLVTSEGPSHVCSDILNFERLESSGIDNIKSQNQDTALSDDGARDQMLKDLPRYSEEIPSSHVDSECFLYSSQNPGVVLNLSP